MQPLDKLLVKIDPLFKAPAFDPAHIPAGMPLHKLHKELLQRKNGGYFYGGALHVFGACAEPGFHSLAEWNDPSGWRVFYDGATDGLFFFAEDAFGDQFALDAKGRVLEFHAESGKATELADNFEQWLQMAVVAPDELLGRATFARWALTHGRLQPGWQLQAYPPFLFVGDGEDPEQIALEAVDALENMEFHASIARQLAAIPEGQAAQVEVTDDGIVIRAAAVESGDAPAQE